MKIMTPTEGQVSCTPLALFSYPRAPPWISSRFSQLYVYQLRSDIRSYMLYYRRYGGSVTLCKERGIDRRRYGSASCTDSARHVLRTQRHIHKMRFKFPGIIYQVFQSYFFFLFTHSFVVWNRYNFSLAETELLEQTKLQVILKIKDFF